MAKFDECLKFSLEKMEIPFTLRSKQVEILEKLFDLKDSIVVLPTGYGKSLLFQLLPTLMQKKYNMAQPMIVLVATPLNSIMEDQVQSLKHKCVKACYISHDSSTFTTYNGHIEEDDDSFEEATGLKKEEREEEEEKKIFRKKRSKFLGNDDVVQSEMSTDKDTFSQL